jgi:hypothetical protein
MIYRIYGLVEEHHQCLKWWRHAPDLEHFAQGSGILLMKPENAGREEAEYSPLKRQN